MNYFAEGFTLGGWRNFYGPFESFGAAEWAAKLCLTCWSCTRARVVNVSGSFVREVSA